MNKRLTELALPLGSSWFVAGQYELSLAVVYGRVFKGEV